MLRVILYNDATKTMGGRGNEESCFDPGTLAQGLVFNEIFPVIVLLLRLWRIHAIRLQIEHQPKKKEGMGQ